MRYYTNGCGGRFNHHVLLNDTVISEIVRQSNSPDLFCSVQSYDMNGTETMSQLVFDIDKEDHRKAHEIARNIIKDVTSYYNCHAELWFSGSKGFHVVTNLGARGDKANVAMKEVALRFTTEADPSMYKIRSMFRLPNSINGKSGLRKIQVSFDEALESILRRACMPQPFNTVDIDFTNERFLDDHNRAVENVVYTMENNIGNDIKADGEWAKKLPPCMKTLLDEGVPEGYRWHFCFYLVRFWRECGVTADEAIELSFDIGLFQEAGYTAGMILHYYSNQRLALGCRTGTVSTILQDNCSRLCKFSEDYTDAITRNFIEAL